MYLERLSKIENLLGELDTELHAQVRLRTKSYLNQPLLARLFSQDRNIEDALNSLIQHKMKISQLTQKTNNRKELAAELNLYSLNTAVLAAKLDNRKLAEKAETLRKLSDELRTN